MCNSTKEEILQEKLIDHFIGLIANNILKPDDKLPGEGDLCAQFDLTIPIVREAMNMLRYMGYIETTEEANTYVVV